MKQIITFISLITFTLTFYGQTLSEKQIYGNWKVKEIAQKPSNPQFQPLIEGFENATFSFSENGKFNLSTTSKSELFGMITEMTENTKWKFELSEQYVKIGNEEDGYTIMGISVKQINGKRLFYLDESGMTFEVEKSK